MMAKPSMCLAAAFLLFKLVSLLFPSLRRCIHSHSLLKNKQQQPQQWQAHNFKEEHGTVEELPDHLTESILLPLLPFKTLIRFRSVSKQWNFIISTKLIINTSHVIYLDCSAKNRFFFPLKYAQLQATTFPNAGTHGMWSYPPPRLVEKRLRIDVESRIFKERSLYMSSCNGMACFIRTGSSFHNMCIQVLNIVTRTFRQVSGLPDYLLYVMRTRGIEVKKTMLGFGYDPTIDDFKIVFVFRSKFTNDPCLWITLVMPLKNSNTWIEADYYSSNSQILSRVESCQDGHSVAVAGNVFWIVTVNGNLERLILKFSLADERFKLISFPIRVRNRGTYKLSCHDRSLYLTIQNGNRIDLWKLPVSNASYVWNKVTTITIPPPPSGRNIIGFSSCLPLGFDNNGNVIIVVEGVLYACKLGEKKFVKLLDSSSNCRFLHLVPQTQSLACL